MTEQADVISLAERRQAATKRLLEGPVPDVEQLTLTDLYFVALALRHCAVREPLARGLDMRATADRIEDYAADVADFLPL